jgi:CRISPR-associated endonuclease/helicase Cas3
MYIDMGNLLNEKTVYAHLSEDKKETLIEHTELTKKYLNKILEDKKIKKIIDDLIINLEIKGNIKSLINEMFYNAIILHDIGKINPLFQIEKMSNKYLNKEKYKNINSTDHSIISSIIYSIYYIEKILKNYRSNDEKYLLIYFNLLFSYNISRHHSNLENMDEFIDKMSNYYNKILDNKEFLDLLSEDIKNTIVSNEHGYFSQKSYYKIERNSEKIIKENYIENMLLTKLNYSLIVSSDYYATYEFFNGEITDIGLIDKKEQIIENYQSTEIYKNIEKYKNNEMNFEKMPINKLRTEMFLESENELKQNIEKDIFYLEAPTGSGKTNTSINLALNLLEVNKMDKIIYVFPFNTLVEQTYEILKEIFGQELDPVVINSLTGYYDKKNEKESEIEYSKSDYDQILLDRIFWHYPFIITTHVNLFQAFFGNSRNAHYSLLHLTNSIIIIDEIQSYKNSLWEDIINYFDKFAKYLNIKFIIMSATLPKLDKMLENKKSHFVDLIKKPDKYFKNPLFKNRVNLNFELLRKEGTSFETLKNHILENTKGKDKILIEFIEKKEAFNFYKYLKKEIKRDIELITSDDNPIERQRIISKAKNKEGFILISTQVIEAGVDIDMDIGYKNIGYLDNEEQFLGRINRSSKKKDAIVYFFKITDPKKIYKNDARTLFNILEYPENIENLKNKNFNDYYKNVFQKIKTTNQKHNENSIESRKNKIKILDFRGISNDMKLIDDEKIQIFLNFDETINGEIISGKEVWEEFKKILEEKTEYSEKKYKLSKIYQKMNYFLKQVNKFIKKESYSEKIGEIYYYPNGEIFFEDGKFSIEKFKDFEKGDFIPENDIL